MRRSLIAVGAARNPGRVADAVEILSLQTGHSIILNTSGLSRVAVGDGRIAGVVPIGTSQLVVNGKAPGHTTIFVWSGVKRERPTNFPSRAKAWTISRKTIRAAIDEPNVQVVTFNYNIILRGTVPDDAAFDRIGEILKRFNGIKFSESGRWQRVERALHQRRNRCIKPLGNLQDEIAAIPGGRALRVDTDPKGNVIVSGTRSRRDGRRAVTYSTA